MTMVMDDRHVIDGVTVFLFDSMGTVRDPLTDTLFPGAAEALMHFYAWAREQGKVVGVVTNGPRREAYDFVTACVNGGTAPLAVPRRQAVRYYDGSARAPEYRGSGLGGVFAGGGEICFVENGTYFEGRLVKPEGVKAVARVEDEVKRDPFLDYVITVYKDAYKTASVVTLPETLAKFQRNAGNTIPPELHDALTQEQWIPVVLAFLKKAYEAAAARQNSKGLAPYLIKPNNRRGYQYAGELADGTPLNKLNGTRLALRVLGIPYDIRGWAYVADGLMTPPERVMLTDGYNDAALGVDVDTAFPGSKYTGTEKPPLLTVQRAQQFLDYASRRRAA